MRTAGSRASAWVAAREGADAQADQIGVQPVFGQQGVRTVMAAGRMAWLCGLMITGLPVASAANRP